MSVATQGAASSGQGMLPRLAPMGSGLLPLPSLVREMQHYTDVLMGRRPAPMDGDMRPLALQEVATAYYARAREIEALIYIGEITPVDGEDTMQIPKGSDLYRFRTGALASFIELFKRSADLGSRRLTEAVYIQNERYDAGGGAFRR